MKIPIRGILKFAPFIASFSLIISSCEVSDSSLELIIEMQKSDSPRGAFFQMAEEDVKDLMRVPYNMIGSDGKIEIPGVEVPHPRAYGAFPRVMSHYARDAGVLTLIDAIRKMTSLPAQAMGFRHRGVLKPGQAADVVVFCSLIYCYPDVLYKKCKENIDAKNTYGHRPDTGRPLFTSNHSQ